MKLERDTERKLIAKAYTRGGLVLKLPANQYKGIPDRIVLMPDGQIAFVELKRPEGGSLSELQKYWIKRLQALGFRACVVKNETEIETLLNDMTEDDNGTEETT